MYRARRIRGRMMSKIILPRFFTVLVEPSRFASLVVTLWGYKEGGCSCATYIFPHDIPPFLRLLPYG
jgi:hypothetical protein